MSKRLLIIDDSPVGRRYLRQNLPKDLDFEITEAEDAIKGVAAFRGTRPDLVLLDLIMPGIGGMRALKMILKTDPSARVIVTTASTGEENHRGALEAGAKAVLTKPVNLDKLDRVVRANL